jgi:hypothetical protein
MSISDYFDSVNLFQCKKLDFIHMQMFSMSILKATI